MPALFKHKLLQRTMVSTSTPNSCAVTATAALNAELANVVVSTYSATLIVTTHFRQSGRFCGLPLSAGPYQSTTKLSPLMLSKSASSIGSAVMSEDDEEAETTVTIEVEDAGFVLLLSASNGVDGESGGISDIVRD